MTRRGLAGRRLSIGGRRDDFDLAAIGTYAWIPFLVAGFGNLLGGWLSSYLLKRGYSVTVARKSAITIFAFLMTSAIPAVLVNQAWLSIAFVSIAMFGYTGSLANMLTLPGDLTSARLQQRRGLLGPNDRDAPAWAGCFGRHGSPQS